MVIADKLRKENIAEFLLYMWQVEDIIRAYDCSLSLIKDDYISRFHIEELETYEEMVDWYGNLIRMMNQEGKREKGHLTSTTSAHNFWQVQSFLSTMLNIIRYCRSL